MHKAEIFYRARDLRQKFFYDDSLERGVEFQKFSADDAIFFDDSRENFISLRGNEIIFLRGDLAKSAERFNQRGIKLFKRRDKFQANFIACGIGREICFVEARR